MTAQEGEEDMTMRRLSGLLVLLAFGFAATGVSLVVAALMVRMFADDQGGTTKLVLIGAGAFVGGGVGGLLSEPAVTWVQKRLHDQCGRGS